MKGVLFYEETIQVVYKSEDFTNEYFIDIANDEVINLIDFKKSIYGMEYYILDKYNKNKLKSLIIKDLEILDLQEELN